MRRLLLVLLVLVLIVAAVAGGAGVYVARSPFPQISGSVRVSGLGDPVEVVRDRWGISHVFARSSRAMFFAQGFVHAQDRLWQMELNRRTASGRLAEILGEAALPTDRFLRTLGLRRVAEAHLGAVSPATRQNLDAYAAGVNAFISGDRGRLPIEFTLLRFTPEPWTPTDSLAYGKLMAWVLGGDWRVEILRQQLLERFGDGATNRLLPEYPSDAPIITGGWHLPGLGLRNLPGIGSNNWVVAGNRTETGSPLLANDPHLESQMPSIWYLMHLNGGPYDVIGATFPGVPGVIVGHNRDIAWGVTNANPDVQDLYIERFHPEDPARYLHKGQWIPATVVRETIAVKGWTEPAVETVRITRHGPILNNVVRGLQAPLALRWTALESSSIIESVDGINRASTWEEFRQALRAWDAPSQNFVFAHKNGEIGYQMPGRIPVRAKGTGAVPVPGWTGEHEWTGWLPFEALPSAHRRDGFIVTANNRIAPPDYPHFLGSDWDVGYRAARITALLSEGTQSVQTFQRIHSDVTSLPGRAIVEALRPVRILDPVLQPLFAELLQWDGVLSASSRPAAVYEALLDSLLKEVFRTPLDEAVFARYLRQYEGAVQTLLALLRDPASGWWRGSRDRLVETALRDATRTLTVRLGSNRDRWRWGRLHQTTFVHPIGRIKSLAWIFNTTTPEVGGDAFTVNNGAFFPEEPFRQLVVASYRQILDPADWDRSLVIHTTGQSGLPFHRHYRDFAALWARGEYVPLLFSRPKIEEVASGKLVLTPK